jgi:hypothetical protein
MGRAKINAHRKMRNAESPALRPGENGAIRHPCGTEGPDVLNPGKPGRKRKEMHFSLSSVFSVQLVVMK